MKKRFGTSLNESTEGSASHDYEHLCLSLVEIPKKDKENRHY